MRFSRDYAKADAVKRMLLKFYGAACYTGWGQCLLGGTIFRSRAAGLPPEMFERQAVLAVDGERFLLSLDSYPRWAIVAVVLHGETEMQLARRLRTAQSAVSRAYWRGIHELYAKFVATGYLVPVETEAEKTGGEPSVAGMETGVAEVGA